MDLSLSEEQVQVQDALTKFIQREYTFEHRRAGQAMPEGFSRDTWARLAGMGLLAMPFAEADGGLGGGAAEMLVTMTAIGSGLVVEPYLQTVVLAGGAIARAGNAGQKAKLLRAICEGRLIAAAAFSEPEAGYELGDVATVARQEGGEYVIAGRKAVVVHGGQADMLVVSARTSGARNDPDGISLFVVDRAARGVAVRDYRTIDGLRAAELTFDEVRVPAAALLGERDAALPVIEAVADAATAALCAEAVGLMEALNRQTLDYLKARKQFGQPIGTFQALQHRAVDMFIHAEQSKSIAWLAVSNAPVCRDVATCAERRRAVSAAKVHIGNSGRRIAQEAIQLHGGMGVTHELPAAHYAKRLTMIDFVLGDTAHHLARFQAAGA